MPTLFPLLSLIASSALASTDASLSKTHLGSEEQQATARGWNRSKALMLDLDSPPDDWNAVRPFSEIEKTGYVAISGNEQFELADLRLAIAQNLPQDVSLVVYVDDKSMIPALRALYEPYLGKDRLKFLVVPVGDDEIWARDALPFPVYTKSGVALVASMYPQSFDPNDTFAKAFSLPEAQTGVYFRGGNLLFDLDGNCFAERASEVDDLGDDQATRMFRQYFGCSSVTILDYANEGIGDIDERIKFLPNKKAITDYKPYADLLKSKGYDVQLLPTTGSDIETYMNTLVVNGTIFVPQMGVANDSAALAAYRALGFKPVGVKTKDLADIGRGNIHCLTMNYPPGTFSSNVAN